MRHDDPSLGQKVFDVPQAQGETVIRPDCVSDDGPRETMALETSEIVEVQHPSELPGLCRTINLTMPVEDGAPHLAEAAGLVEVFQKMIRNRKPDLLDAWLHRAEQGLLSWFADGLHADRGATIAAIEEPWSNGQTEGHINRLKMLKRQMYGRAKLDLLRAKMMIA